MSNINYNNVNLIIFPSRGPNNDLYIIMIKTDFHFIKIRLHYR